MLRFQFYFKISFLRAFVVGSKATDVMKNLISKNDTATVWDWYIILKVVSEVVNEIQSIIAIEVTILNKTEL